MKSSDSSILKIQYAVFHVTNLHDTNHKGTFRHAIHRANEHEHSMIVFDVKGTIKLSSSLPEFKTHVHVGKIGVAPKVEINCHGHSGLVFESGAEKSEISGLAVVNAKGDGLVIWADKMLVRNCYFGVKLDGSEGGNAGNGI